MATGEIRVLGDGNQDATMVDIGEKNRPPSDPPDGRGQWVKKLMGRNVGGMLRPEDVLDDDFVAERMTVEFPDGVEGEPVITIGNEVLEAMNGLWKNCMIVKVLGRNIPIAVLSKRLRELWKPNGEMCVIDLPRQFYMVRFEREEEYLSALTGGPWRLFGSYLTVQAWSPTFYPLNLYHPKILMGIANGLGKPVKVDLTTQSVDRARFARVCVEVDLSKPLRGTVLINGERFFVAYEGLANICASCGMYGHLVHQCSKGTQETVVVLETQMVGRSSAGSKPGVDGFTQVRRGRKAEPPRGNLPTMVEGSKHSMERNQVTRDKGKGIAGITTSNTFCSLAADMVDLEREGEVDTPVMIQDEVMEIGKGAENITIENSFGSLATEMETIEKEEGGNIHDANKENVDSLNQGNRWMNRVTGKDVVFGAGSKKSVNGPRGVNKDTKGGPLSSFNNTRPKQQKSNRPTRGKVYGPALKESDLSASGKRLRIEQEGLGRPGGCFANASSGRTDEVTVAPGHGKTLAAAVPVGGGDENCYCIADCPGFSHRVLQINDELYDVDLPGGK